MGEETTAPAELDTTAAAPSGGPEPVRDLGDLASRLLAQRARLTAALVGVVTAVGAVLVLTGAATGEQVNQAAVVTGGVLTAVGTVLAIVVPTVTAKSAGQQVQGRAEVVRAGVVPVEKVAAYSPAADDVDIALGPSAGVLDAYDPEQP